MEKGNMTRPTLHSFIDEREIVAVDVDELVKLLRNINMDCALYVDNGRCMAFSKDYLKHNDDVLIYKIDTFLGVVDGDKIKGRTRFMFPIRIKPLKTTWMEMQGELANKQNRDMGM